MIRGSLDGHRGVGSGLTWVLSSHDVPRHASRFALPAGTDLDRWLLNDGTDPVIDPAAADRRARAVTLLMLALPGSAYLYQGEELGLLEVADLPAQALVDPVWERTGHTLKGRDGARVPLPWTTSGPSFGFGAGGSWLPQPGWFGDSSVEAQRLDPHSSLQLYRTALRLRRSLTVDDSELAWVETGSADLLRFRRSNGWECVVNFSPHARSLPDGEPLLRSRRPAPGDEAGTLPGETALWLRS